MQEAKTTWAVVVGIDQYDDPGIGRLEGAAADAVAAVRWLRAIGVPDRQILLHAAPCEKTRPDIDALGVPRLEDEASGVPCGPARLNDIWDSFLLLAEKSGTRLFVFFSGHGLYDPETERLFLAQDAKSGAWHNLGMNLLGKYLLSLSFPRVFLFLDGCQNYPGAQDRRSPVRARIPGGEERNATPGHALAACYAAEKGEVAREIAGRGVFLRHLLAGLDPTQPNGDAVVFDFATGARSLDLCALMGYVAEEVQKEARQTPRLDPGDGWPPSQPICLLRLPKVETAAVSLQVEPAEAVPDVVQVALSTEDLPKEWRVLRPAEFPLATCLPVAARALATCYLRRDAPWRPTRDHKPFDVTADQAPVRFRFEPLTAPPEPAKPPGAFGAPPEDIVPDGGGSSAQETMIELTTRDAGGNTRSHQIDYDQVAGSLGLPKTPEEGRWQDLGGGVGILRREIGPQFRVQTEALGTGGLVVADWMRMIERFTPHEISVSVTAPESLQPWLRVVLPAGGAEALAGALAGEGLLWIGSPADAPLAPLWLEPVDEARALAAVAEEPLVPVSPGPVKVRLDLPWGTWSTVAHAPLFGEVVVELPEKVGLPPLRVVLRGESQAKPESRERRRIPVPAPVDAAVVGAGTAPAGRLRGGLYAKGTVPLQATATGRSDGDDAGPPWLLGDPVAPFVAPGGARWKLRPRRLPGLVEPSLWLGNELAELALANGRSAVFPLPRGHRIGVDLSRADPQVEPLSAVALPAWDLMMAAGRLDSIGHREVEALLALQQEEPLTVVLAGYAVYANPLAFSASFLNRVKKQVAEAADPGEAGPSLLDFDLLDLALAARKHNRKSARLQVQEPQAWFRAHAAERLRPWARAGSVPALRWGVRLLLQLLDWAAEDEDFNRWRKALAALEPRLSPLSAWTAWTEKAERGR